MISRIDQAQSCFIQWILSCRIINPYEPINSKSTNQKRAINLGEPIKILLAILGLGLDFLVSFSLLLDFAFVKE